MFRVVDDNGKIKYSGRSKATVLDNRDPNQKGRIIVDHPLLGETVWIDYLKTPGQFNVPSIGDIVYVEADAGHPEFPIAWGNVEKGTYAQSDVPTAFKRDIPTNRGWQTPGGHLVELDDGLATLTTAPNDTTYTTSNKGIRITTSGGNKIHIAEDTSGGNEYILVSDKANNSIKIDSSTNTITITNSNNKIFELNTKQILGQGTEPLVLGTTWFNMMNTFLTSVINGITPGTTGQNANSLIAIQQAATTLKNTLPNLKSTNSFTD